LKQQTDINYQLNDNDGEGKKIGIVKSLWNNNITSMMYKFCLETLTDHGVSEKNIYTLEVPGSFELIYGGKKILRNKNLDAVILIGSIIKGETPHFEFISQAVTNGVKDLNILYDIPFIFCVSTDLNLQQALSRSGGQKGNKGRDAAKTALQLIKE